VPAKAGIHSAAAHAALAEAKKKSKSATCSNSSKLYVYPCTIKETTSGQISFALVGQKLNPVDNYTVNATALDFACGSAITGTVELTDLSGRFNDVFFIPGPCIVPSGGTCFAIELQDNNTPFTVSTTKLCVKNP
jgi:hypothetical protein